MDDNGKVCDKILQDKKAYVQYSSKKKNGISLHTMLHIFCNTYLYVQGKVGLNVWGCKLVIEAHFNGNTCPIRENEEPDLSAVDQSNVWHICCVNRTILEELNSIIKELIIVSSLTPS